MKHPLTTTSNGIAVYVDLIHSPAAKRIAHQPHLLRLIQEVLEQTTLHGRTMHIEHNLGRTIGYSQVVSTTDQDNIFYAQLLRDQIYTRFVKNGTPLATNYVTLALRQADDNTYELCDAWIGRLSPPRPGSDNETTESKSYWQNHAHIPDQHIFQLRTVTKVCPY